jgi:hypothetical protein
VRSTSSGAPVDANRGRRAARLTAQVAELVAERGQRRGIRELAPEEQVPHVFDRSRGGQLDGRVLAVVEEALPAAHVTDRRLGHDDAIEAGWDVGARFGGRPDAGHSDEIAQRDHTHAASVLDDGQVAIAVRCQALPCPVDALVRFQHIRARGHPQADELARRVASGGDCSQQVPLGQDSRDLVVVGHDHRAGLRRLHGPGRGRQGVHRRADDGGGCHEVSHACFHGVHYACLHQLL